MADDYLQFSETLDALTPEDGVTRAPLEPIAVINRTGCSEDDDVVRNRETSEPTPRGRDFYRTTKTFATTPTSKVFMSSFKSAKPTMHGSPPMNTAMPTVWPTSSRSFSNGSVRISAGRSATPPLVRKLVRASSAVVRCSSRLTRFARQGHHAFVERSVPRSEPQSLYVAPSTTFSETTLAKKDGP